MPKTVLLVDDEVVVVDIAKRKLDQMGYNVLAAHDGEEAVEILRTAKPDLIVLDVQMPKMNGYTFLTELRKNTDQHIASIPVIMVTAYAETNPIFNRHGVIAYLLKPLKLQELLDKIQEVLGSPK
jgi:CheY-like chemotaxis protein